MTGPDQAHGFTTHGFRCCYLAGPQPQPRPIARCGGPTLCHTCGTEIHTWHPAGAHDGSLVEADEGADLFSQVNAWTALEAALSDAVPKYRAAYLMADTATITITLPDDVAEVVLLDAAPDAQRLLQGRLRCLIVPESVAQCYCAVCGGEHVVVHNEATSAAAELIRRLYANPHGGTGGPLHCELDDNNLEWDDPFWGKPGSRLTVSPERSPRYGPWPTEIVDLAVQIADALNGMSVYERHAALADARGLPSDQGGPPLSDEELRSLHAAREVKQ